ATARPSLAAQPENCLRTSQLRFTCRAPEVPPCLVRETDGAALVSVTLVSRTGAAAGAGGAGGAAGGGVTGRAAAGWAGGAAGGVAGAACCGSSTVMP